MSISPNGAPRRSLRKMLLGGAAALALGGSLGFATLSPEAQAQSPVQQAQMQGGSVTKAPPLTIPGAIPSFADVIERVKGAVVSVRVRTVSDVETTGSRGMPDLQPGDPLERFFRRFGEEGQGPGNGRRERQHGMAQGSGFIISADGYVVTNNHVVKNAEEVTLGLDDGRSVTAKVIGTDEKTDLALLKINEEGTYTFAEWTDGSPRIGDWVLAVGNPFGLGGTVTAGIVSARGRDIGAGPYDDFLQIDAPVNRGNSGGPAFDLFGRVVGVNTAIYSPSGGSVGIGFAIPATTARQVVQSLRDKGYVARGYIGVQIQAITPEIAESMRLPNNHGALVADAQPNTPAARAGLKAGDVIVSVNGDRIEAPRELSRKIAALGPKASVDLKYLRDGREQSASVMLDALPDQTADAGRNPRRGGMDEEEGDRGARLGLRLAPGQNGVAVAEVEPDSPAARQGLRSGDTIVEVAGQRVSRPADVASAVRDARRDRRKTVLMRVRTGDATRYVALPTAGAS